MLTRFARRLWQHYEDYHSYGPARLKTIGVLGAITYVLFYFLRFTRPHASLTAGRWERSKLGGSGIGHGMVLLGSPGHHDRPASLGAIAAAVP